MPRTDYKYGHIPQSNYKHGLSLSEVDDQQKSSALPRHRDGHITVPMAVEVKQVAPWSVTVVRCVTKVKGFNVLLGLISFLMMMSFLLTWDKKGLPGTLLPLRLAPSAVDNLSALSFNRSSALGEMDMEPLVKTVVSRLDLSSPRKVPSLEDVVRTDPHLFSVIPRQFLPNIKSPCWYEEHLGNIADLYSTNLYRQHSVSFRAVCDSLKDRFLERLHHSNGRVYRLRCLPSFYIIGQPKSGTTDLYHRLLLHPEVRFPSMKEPHWWTRKRFGVVRLQDGAHDHYAVEDYLDLFDLAAHHIQEGILGNVSEGHGKKQLITGEASVSTMWDNHAGNYSHGNRTGGEPAFLVQDFIHAAQPRAKIIIMLRDPVERLYSDYLYFHLANKSVERFHHKVCESLQMFQACLSESSIRSCVYNTQLFLRMPVRLSLGMYIIYLLDWLTVFHRDQILVLRLEDYAANLRVTMHQVFHFLGLGPISAHREALLTRKPMSNTRRAPDRSLGPMLSLTRDMLRQFYQPFNLRLARLLDKQAFLWTDT